MAIVIIPTGIILYKQGNLHCDCFSLAEGYDTSQDDSQHESNGGCIFRG